MSWCPHPCRVLACRASPRCGSWCGSGSARRWRSSYRTGRRSKAFHLQKHRGSRRTEVGCTLGLQPVLRSHKIFVGSGSTDPYLWLIDPDPDPAIFAIDLQDVTKKFFVLFVFLLFTFWRYIHLHHFSKTKNINKSQNCENRCLSYCTIFAWW